MTKKTAGRELKDPKNWREATRLVHGGTLRSQFGETSEALFLTQGFVYDTAEAAEARFKGRIPASSIRAMPIRPSRCSRSAWPARRRRGGPRDGERHGGGHGP